MLISCDFNFCTHTFEKNAAERKDGPESWATSHSLRITVQQSLLTLNMNKSCQCVVR